MPNSDPVTDLFVKTYADRGYRYPTMVRHNGMVLAFAMDADRHIYFAALDPAGPAPTRGAGMATAGDVDRWPANPQALRFATELASVGFGVADQIGLPTVRVGSTTAVPAGTQVRPGEIDVFRSSTARFTADAPFQVLSDGRYVYLFRQAIADPSTATLDGARAVLGNTASSAEAHAQAQGVITDHENTVYLTDATGALSTDEHGNPVSMVAGTLLVDRFVLVGAGLEAKLEVRFQRSRSKSRPASATDSLGSSDLDQRPFVEPTQQLRFLPELRGGRFTAVLVPTAVAEVFRWQLFTYDSSGSVLWSYNIERSADGLFNTQGSQAYTCPDHPDVYALSAGSCPRPSAGDDHSQTCDKTLVPRVDTGGAAGSALSFPAGGGTVTLQGAASLGQQYTVEAWLCPDPAGTGDRALLSSSKDPRKAGPSVYLVDGTAVRTGFGDTRSWYEVTTPPILATGVWQHLAITFDGRLLQVYVDGALRHASSVLAGRAVAATPPDLIGGGFAGLLDELRLWSVPLAAADLQIGRYRRLTGLETRLVGYWRLDESSGTTVWDQSSTAAVATITGAQWVTSDAPIAQSVGLSRSAIRLTGRYGAGGLNAAVYYQQEPAASGYDGAGGTARPIKQAARVMLAAVTGTRADDLPTITALDFGVAADGSLATLPVAVPLVTVSPGGTDAGGTNAALQIMRAAQANVAADDAIVLSLTARLPKYRQVIAAIDAALRGDQALAVPAEFPDVAGAQIDMIHGTTQVANMKAAVGIIAEPERHLLLAEGQAAVDAARNTLAAAKLRLYGEWNAIQQSLAAAQAQAANDRAALAAAEQAINGDTSLSMPLLSVDGRGLTVCGANLGFAQSAEAPLLFDSALGRLMLYFRGPGGEFFVAYYDASTDHARFAMPAQTGLATFIARGTEAEFDALSITLSGGGSTLTVSLPGAAGVTETWRNVPDTVSALAAVLNGTAAAPVPVALTDHIAGKVTTIALKEPLRINLDPGDLLQAADMVVMVTAKTDRDATAIPIAPTDLSLPAGTLLSRTSYDYASASSTRAGADLSKGSLLVALDARAADGALQSAATAPAGATAGCRWFGAAPGTTVDFRGSTTSVGVLARTALTFNGFDSVVRLQASTALAITGPITLEAWIRPTATNGPRDIIARGPLSGEVYLRVLDGSYQIGSYNGTDHFTAAPVPAGDLNTWVHLAGVYDGAAWRLYRNGLPISSTVDSTGAVPANANWSIGASGVTGGRCFAGDIDEVRIWNRSRDAQEITEAMNHRLSGTEAGLVGYWYGSGGTFVDHTAHANNGIAHSVAPTGSPAPLTRLSGFDTTKDVTVEAWVNAASTDEVSRLLVHQSPACGYGLGLRLQHTAMRFNGLNNGMVSLPNVPALAFTGLITMEAWIRPTASTDVRTVIAHGYVNTPAAEVSLRINGGNYETGNWRGGTTGAGVFVPVDPNDLNNWVHLASVFDGSMWRLYRNGVQIGSKADTYGAIAVNAAWTIGGSHAGDRVFAGDIDEVRIWRVARGAADIHAGMNQRLTGDEPGLVGLWRFDDGHKRGGPAAMRDATALHNDGTTFNAATGVPGGIPGPAPMYSVVFTEGNQTVETIPAFPAQTWTHLAGVFSQSYGVRFAGTGSYLDAGSSQTLNLNQDLTIEVAVQLDDLSTPQGLISRGRLDDGTDADVPYALWAGTDGSVVFTFEDVTHKPSRFSSPSGVLIAGQFQRVAVTRKHYLTVDTSTAHQPGGGTVVDSWDDITFYVDGSRVGAVSQYRGPDIGVCDSGTVIGRVLVSGGQEYPLRGTVAEARLWSTARNASVISKPIKGTELGLAAWWRMEDATGNAATDSKGGHHAALRGAASWAHTPDPYGSPLTVYLDGVPVAAANVPAGVLAAAESQFSLGALGNNARADFFRGQLEEVRIWRAVRTTEQIQDNLFGRLTGDYADLIAYYTMDAGGMLSDGGLRGNDLPVQAASYVLSTAPIGDDTPLARNVLTGLATRFNRHLGSAPAATEYAMLQTAADGTPGAAFRRAYAFVDATGAWRLVTGFTVGDMTAEWVGQAQFDPQLIGYLEGAPPVPSENLTVADSYAGASTVAFTEATSSTYTYASSRDSGFDSSFELSVGQGAEGQTFLGLIEIEAPLGIGVGQVEMTSAVEGGFDIGAKANFEMSLSWLNDSSHGTGTTQTRVSSLGLTGAKEVTAAYPVGQRFVPDNTGFALVQSQTADVFALRLAHTGALIAYQMRPNPDIPKDWNVITFPINSRYTKQGVLDGKVGHRPDKVDYPNALRPSPDISYFKPIEAYALKSRIQRQEQELATLFAQRSVDANQLSGGTLPDAVLPVRQNLVNTYVWTADGGQFAETQQGMDTYSESAGGAYAFAGMAGITASMDVSIFGAAVSFGMSAMFGGHLNLSITKTKDSEHDFGVDASAAPEQDITTRDSQGNRVGVPGKVDAYRWMTFYLAPQAEHHDLFFNQVVDPIWLAQSGDASAVALRQARQDSKRPAAWRVLHRVTYVSRVLEPLSNQPPSLEKTLRSLDIASNYELVRTLEPLLRGKTGRYAEFGPAVRAAVAMYLPDLTPHVDEIVSYLVLYYGIPDAPQLRTS